MAQPKSIVVSFISNAPSDDSNTSTKTPPNKLAIPIDSTPAILTAILSKLLQKPLAETDFDFFINDLELISPLNEFVQQHKLKTESVVNIVYDQHELAKVIPVTRCSSSLPGHKGPILVLKFSPDGKKLATGSGDKTVRLWDLATEMPLHVFETHENWVQAIGWSPNSQWLVSGCYNGTICLWDTKENKLQRKVTAHKKAVLDICWDPVKLESEKFASCSLDGSIKIWRRNSHTPEMSLSGHTAAVTSICWGFKGHLYSASRDRTIRVWDVKNGLLFKCLSSHSHWVNHISLNTSYALRMGIHSTKEEGKKLLQKALNSSGGKEMLVSASDDHSAFLWDPLNSEQPVSRLLGHQQPLTFVRFSPDGRYIATVSFDKSVRLWNGLGQFVKTFRGHVGAVYQVCWSKDSRFFVTGSKDSTMKLWGVKELKRKGDLPGHADEVYAVDWSLDGEKVVSGGKDGELRIWRN